MSFNSGKTGAEVMDALAKADGEQPISFSGYTGANPSAIFYRLLGSGLGASASNFNFSVKNFPGVNLPGGDARDNNVVNIGWNVGTNGARENPNEAMLRIAFEEHFKQPGKPAAFEFHLSSMDEAGVEHRPISSYLHKDGSPGSDLSFNVDICGFSDYNYAQKLKYDFTGPTAVATYVGPWVHRFGNNTTPFQQTNAAGDGLVNLWWVDSSDRLRAENGLVTAGPMPAGGSFVEFQPTTMPDGGRVLTLTVPSGNVAANAYVAQGECQQTFAARLWNDSGAVGGHAMYELRVLGPSAGDVFVRYNINAAAGWAVGVDNSDDDAFVWSEWSPGNSNRMRLSFDGILSLPMQGAGINISEGVNARQGVVTLMAGEAVVANTQVKATSRILLTSQEDGGAPGFLRVSARTPGVGFTITSSSVTDESVVAFLIMEPA